ncbi:hypothetical protein K1T71_012128 [Dendrolimus kikuchii]|uniref:Uncharacterized protein n=1 Tax=Dendrolimus kikuchii TaxID=765133 RepID=A0ACC1CKR0_9NEOP|nr:hypothetical protein K1T71_012128 [Dendrolimus kikuchii]
MFLFYGAIVAVSFVIYKIYNKLTCGKCTCDTKMQNKVVLVTGSNTGIGYETAKDLAHRGARVILACRDMQKGTNAKDEIINITGNKHVILKHLDLASFKSVRKFADDILKTESRLDVLINNAGMGNLDNHLTEDNLPVETQVNYFGPFLLTILLLPLLKSSAPSRIINVASMLHKIGKVDVVNFDKPAKSRLLQRRVYSDTKLGNVLFTMKLSEVLKGTGVTANSLHPGAVSTEIFRNVNPLWKLMLRLLFKSPKEGAQTSIHLAVAPELSKTTGKYFSDCRESTASSRARDRELAEKLWELSENVVFANKKGL